MKPGAVLAQAKVLSDLLDRWPLLSVDKHQQAMLWFGTILLVFLLCRYLKAAYLLVSLLNIRTKLLVLRLEFLRLGLKFSYPSFKCSVFVRRQCQTLLEDRGRPVLID